MAEPLEATRIITSSCRQLIRQLPLWLREKASKLQIPLEPFFSDTNPRIVHLAHDRSKKNAFLAAQSEKINALLNIKMEAEIARGQHFNHQNSIAQILARAGIQHIINPDIRSNGAGQLLRSGHFDARYVVVVPDQHSMDTARALIEARDQKEWESSSKWPPAPISQKHQKVDYEFALYIFVVSPETFEAPERSEKTSGNGSHGIYSSGKLTTD